MSGLSTIISTQPRKNDKQINIFVNSEQFLIFIAYISSMKSKTATIFVCGNECLSLSISFSPCNTA